MTDGEAKVKLLDDTSPVVYAASTDPLELLSQYDGLLIREKLFWSQVLFGACEKQTQFTVAPWSQDMPERLDESAFSSVEEHPLLEIRESSPCCCPWGRYPCHNYRQARFGVYPPLSAAASGARSGWPQNSDARPIFIVDRPFKCTVMCCCYLFNPPKAVTTVPLAEFGSSEQTEQIPVAPIGEVELSWKWWNAVWPCLLEYDVRDHATNARTARAQKAATYTVEVAHCFARDCVNCCAPTCFNPIFSMPVRDAQSGLVVGELQNQWPGCNARGLCQGNSQADNYVIKFPPQSDSSARAGLVSALMLINLVHFERRTNQKN
mmetsp:Transcript_76039/g.152774  ORF Transcript_76039/g.152774 Transcript_76039/m.152774 type:complete len:321 (+) Transcript_76039:41-1003(+)